VAFQRLVNPSCIMPSPRIFGVLMASLPRLDQCDAHARPSAS
jgi:hypothetical protein